MRIKAMCVAVVGCVSLMGWAGAQAPTTDQDKQFVMQASQSDYTEITFSQLAATKATDPKVKGYAQKMISDHTMLEQEMKPIADKLGVTPVTTLDSEHQQLFDQLNGMSGAAFDKQYMSGMSTDHHKALDAFKAEEASTADPQLKTVVKKGEKVVAQHTKMADQLSGKLAGTSAGM